MNSGLKFQLLLIRQCYYHKAVYSTLNSFYFNMEAILLVDNPPSAVLGGGGGGCTLRFAELIAYRQVCELQECSCKIKSNGNAHHQGRKSMF